MVQNKAQRRVKKMLGAFFRVSPARVKHKDVLNNRGSIARVKPMEVSRAYRDCMPRAKGRSRIAQPFGATPLCAAASVLFGL